MCLQPDVAAMRRRFSALHDDGPFLMPNAWDVGSARLLASLGFPALATTSSGHAASLGRRDQRVTRDELLAHAAQLASAVELPVSIDAETCFPSDPGGVATTVRMVAETGAAGVSIEDYDPATGLVPSGIAVERVGVAAEAAHEHGLTLTARAENHLYGNDDLDDTIDRLRAYRRAGADVVYAPGPTSVDDIERLVLAVDAPLNVLALPDGPNVEELFALGVRRVSTGGALAFSAYGALVDSAQELLRSGTSTYPTLPQDRRATAFT